MKTTTLSWFSLKVTKVVYIISFRCKMTSEYYFFDQISHISHIGGVHRLKRNPNDLKQALHYARMALCITDDDVAHTNAHKKFNNNLLHTIIHKIKTPIIPEILTKNLDKITQAFDDKSKNISSSSVPSKTARISVVENEENISEDKLNDSIINSPKISLPNSLITQLQSKWSDLIQNTEYEYRVK